ncbi:MAG: TlpA family protein disulfide reductase [Anaerotardibacter sp.]
MDNKKKLLLVGLVLVCLVTGAALLYNTLSEEASNSFNTINGTATKTDNNETIPAKDFTVYDANGDPHKLSDYQGKPVVLNFWASWCGPCRSEMPLFQEQFDKQGNTITFLMVNLTDGKSETVESASSFVEAQNYTFPILFDTKQEASQTYGIYSVPMTFFIDAQGNQKAQVLGALNEKTLEEGIKLISE